MSLLFLHSFVDLLIIQHLIELSLATSCYTDKNEVV